MTFEFDNGNLNKEEIKLIEELTDKLIIKLFDSIYKKYVIERIITETYLKGKEKQKNEN